MGADKTSNLRDMVRLLERGHTLEAFMSRGIDQQLRKFEALNAVFRGRVRISYSSSDLSSDSVCY
jgi:hypothetical protein